MTDAIDAHHMAHALRLGQRGQGNTWPNPAVGCVIVNTTQIVGRGWTQPGGRPHAEVIALAQAGAAARGATASVTLEPCAHTGQTGPCATALIDAGIARCVIATTDPDARVSGAGIAMLRAAGVQVDLGCLASQAQQAHAGFFKRLGAGRPRITLKLALSADGRIATRTGHSQWITGPQARAHVHLLRLTHDAVMVGGGTARADDPTLTVRGMGDVRQPVRIVASRTCDFEGTALLASRDAAPLWLCHGADVIVPAQFNVAGVTPIPIALDDTSFLDAHLLGQALGTAGLTSVLVEGGGIFAASLLKAGLVDDLMIYTAGVMIGGDGLPGLASLGLDDLGDAARFDLRDVRQIGPDILHHWQRPLAP